jgi:hypothetical protein
MYRALGVQGDRLPDEGCSSRMIDGIMVYADAKIPGMAQDGKRVWAQCPMCSKHITFARLRYHMRVHA